MSNWSLHLFARCAGRTGLLGQRVHAWHYGPYGRTRIIGEVVDETESALVLDISNEQDYKAFRRVWKHDASLPHEALPIDVSDLIKGTWNE